MTNTDKLESEIRSIVAEALEIQPWEINMYAVLGSELRIKYLDLLVVLIITANKFRIKIPFEPIKDIESATIPELVELIDKLLTTQTTTLGRRIP